MRAVERVLTAAPAAGRRRRRAPAPRPRRSPPPRRRRNPRRLRWTLPPPGGTTPAAPESARPCRSRAGRLRWELEQVGYGRHRLEVVPDRSVEMLALGLRERLHRGPRPIRESGRWRAAWPADAGRRWPRQERGSRAAGAARWPPGSSPCPGRWPRRWPARYDCPGRSRR